MTMLQFDLSPIATFGVKAHLNFSLEGWLILPVSTDIPREDQAGGWFPCEYATPLTHASVVTALIPAAPDARLDHRVYCIGFPYFVGGQGPPRAHLLREHPPRHRLRC